ncbi:MAG: hypothetical protein WKG01_32125, partial [Kofleriaceae bacterium]
CTCTPRNASRVKLRDEPAPVNGKQILERLHRHKRDVRLGRNARDIKVDDDQLRFAISNFCDPCNRWVADTMRIEELYPMARLEAATSAVCLGLELRDGTVVYGDARPQACR